MSVAAGAPSAGSDRPVTVAVAGATGRMGRMLIEALIQAPDLVLHSALEVPGHPALGRDAGEFLGQHTGVSITDVVPDALTGARVLIDFTRPAATLEHLAVASRTGTRLVVGTTGFSAGERARIGAAATALPIVLAPNMGVGVNATLKIVEVAAGILAEGYDVEIIEAHHRHKVDAPSGTALWLGEAVARASGRDLERDAVYARHGETGPRKSGSIGFSTIRGGDIVGEHTVMFAGAGEQITITHRSTSRASYAEGALRASRFVATQAPGLYDMQDVLGLR